MTGGAMNDTLLTAVDLGTSFIKAAVYDTAGNQIASSQAPVKSDASRAGIFLQSGEDIYRSVLDTLRELAELIGEKKHRIAAIGFTGQMAGFIGAGRGWEDITTWSCSLDTRYAPYAEEQIRTMGKDFLEISGTNAPVMAPKITWFAHDFPEQAARVAKYMLISSYVIGRLGNAEIEEAALSSSYATWTGLADIRQKTWSESLCGRLGIQHEKLPRIVDYHTVCGALSEEAAAVTGLPSGIPLAAGAGDKIAGCIGAGILDPGDTTFEASSYAAVSVLADSYRPNPARQDYDAIPALEDGQFYLHRYFPGSGITLQWFIDTFREADLASDQAFQAIEAAAVKVPAGCDRLMAVGMLGGSAMPFDGTLRGAWIGHTWSHRREHFYRALLESYGCELALTLDSIRTMYPDWDRLTDVVLTGGGAKSAIWPQILADTVGNHFILMDKDDAALWGTAVIAGKGVGVFSDIRDVIRAAKPPVSAVRPDPENAAVYQTLKKNYNILLENVCGFCSTVL